jgi:hypothetical protein
VFFLLPKVTLVLLLIFGLLVGVRVWRQRHGSPRRRLGWPPWRRSAPTENPEPLVPASLLRGADRTWLVFVTANCPGCRRVVSRLRAAQLDAEVTEVDCAREPALAQLFAVRRHPTVLLANRYGQVETRLVGSRAVGDAINATTRSGTA